MVISQQHLWGQQRRRGRRHQEERHADAAHRFLFSTDNNNNNNGDEQQQQQQQQQSKIQSKQQSQQQSQSPPPPPPPSSVSQEEYFQSLSARPLPPRPPRATRPRVVKIKVKNSQQQQEKSQPSSSLLKSVRASRSNPAASTFTSSKNDDNKVNNDADTTPIVASSPLTTTTTTTTTNVATKEQAMEELLRGFTDAGWKYTLKDAIYSSASFAQLALFLQEERRRGMVVYPPPEDIFAALNLCPLDTVKVVIVGQDPYHGPGQGHGLAFSVRRGVRPPPSLINILKEAGVINTDTTTTKTWKHGNLESWAQQGVLLLNTVLTVRQGQANSHAKQGWEDFTDAIINVLNHYQPPQHQQQQQEKQRSLVFLLWGSPAHEKAKSVDAHRHVVLRTSHPSPLGATKTKSPFLGSQCFAKANQALIQACQTPIDWSLPEE